MPTYVYRYPRRRYGRRYSRYRRYGAYSRYRRRRSGTSSTASSRGRIRVRVPVQQLVTLTVPAQSTDSNVLTSGPYYQASNVLPRAVAGAVAQRLYTAYVGLYDQVKCDGVVSNLSVVTPIGGAGGLNALQVIMAYDRCGCQNEIIADAITTAQLFNFSSSVARSAINNSVAKMSRSCWASDIQERTVFHDSTVAASNTAVWDRDFSSNATKVGYFAPLLMLGVRLAAAAPESATTVQVLLEQVYYFTFRQPKYGGDPSATANLRSVPALNLRRDARSLDREANMDDAGGLMMKQRKLLSLLPVPNASKVMVKTPTSISPLPSSDNSMKFQ